MRPEFARRPMLKGSRHTPEAVDKLTRANRRNAARTRARAADLPRHLRNLALRKATVHPDVAPLAEAARQEHAALLDALGGPEHVSPQRRALLEDLVGVGLVLRCEIARFALTRDADAVPRITSCANTRRASLAALGLDRIARELPRLDEYLRERSKGAEAPTFDMPREPEPASEGEPE